LEQCTGQAVTSFVPPFNQPFDFPARFAISLSERREVKRDRIGLGHLCELLNETGYTFSRISYQPLHERILKPLVPLEKQAFSRLERINGLTCLRLMIGAGFQNEIKDHLERCVQSSKYLVVYGHPHTLHMGGTQDERYLAPFLEHVRFLAESGRLDVVLPRQLAGMAQDNLSGAKLPSLKKEND